ncbi:MarR family transcriptional regulator [Jiella sp. MQZ9-1]|uniref:MarR family transcriptional regulator n=2 Tax=Jiella flava TaxID=2816857 RepID=A0A939FXY1_9HYPH|nr:MarR family transcriptional regulator [Jiella flava]MCD2470954.1 MarR family transcriptional regulator [Jiella flava]
MTTAQLRIIARLSRQEGLSQAALAAQVDLEPMTLCRHIDRMVAAGLVERQQDPNDRRARMVFTTAKARELIGPMRARADVIFEEAQAGLSPEVRATLMEALATIVENLSDDARPSRSTAPSTSSKTARAETRRQRSLAVSEETQA